MLNAEEARKIANDAMKQRKALVIGKMQPVLESIRAYADDGDDYCLLNLYCYRELSWGDFRGVAAVLKDLGFRVELISDELHVEWGEK